MDSRTFYYAKVSSKEQNLDRQLAAFVSLGASKRDIVTDKESGKDFQQARLYSPENGYAEVWQYPCHQVTRPIEPE